MLEVHRFPEYWISRSSVPAVSPHQSLRKKVGVMATRAPIPYLRVAVCAMWVMVVLLTFATFATASPRSVIFLVAAMIIPPSVFLSLWNDGPPRTVAELLRATEDRR
jgi:hypothetical protein